MVTGLGKEYEMVIGLGGQGPNFGLGFQAGQLGQRFYGDGTVGGDGSCSYSTGNGRGNPPHPI